MRAWRPVPFSLEIGVADPGRLETPLSNIGYWHENKDGRYRVPSGSYICLNAQACSLSCETVGTFRVRARASVCPLQDARYFEASHLVSNCRMDSQLRYRLFIIWLLASGLCLVVFYLHQSASGTTAWMLTLGLNGTKAVVEEPRPNAVIVMLVAPSRIMQAIVALRNIEDRFNRRLKYPYVVLTEAAITEAVRDKVAWVTEGRATFADLPPDMWGTPEFLDSDKIEESIKTIGLFVRAGNWAVADARCRFSTAYRSMCRFYSGFFWRHPAIIQYDWIWRLDSDIVFHCDVPYDPFVRMQSAQALYGFVQVSDDALWVQPSLAGNISAFMATHAHLLPPDANHGFSWRDIGKALRGEAGGEDWTMRTFYNNWEISHRTLWSSELYMSFFEYLDRAGGFFYERWGDAPVHSLGVSMSLRADQVMQFEDMGYEHQRWPYDCPSLARCTCVRDSVILEEFDSHGNQWFNASIEHSSES
ncbi:nucleotide-diphospho-sugar transferase [Gautieria morchelliformis]|nr:nucleotide-diphospho-sugar transferase [Gautieria morchelliformis]